VTTPAAEQLETPAPPDPPAPTQEEVSFPVNAQQIAAANAMGFDLLRGVSALAEADQNLFLSPPSVALALAMVLNGAAGETRAAILEAMHLPGWEDAAVNEAMAGLRQALTGGDLGVELAIANSLWGRVGIPFRAEFLATGQRYYAARIETLDFDDPAASETINAWVKAQTRERIPEIVPKQIDPETILFLINAIYFKGDWELPFRPQATRDQPFTRADGSRVQVPMMSQEDTFVYGESDEWQIVRLPYKGERLSMVVVLPSQGRTVDELAASLDADAWAEMQSEMVYLEGYLALPRFSYSFGASLNEPLKEMGMEIAFEEGSADFSRLHEAPWPTWISDVRHKTFVEVNERGTEAAAVTSIEVQAESMPLERFTFVADRPFLFAIQDNASGSILFIGVLRDPLQTEAQAAG
jgi:serpin B